MTIETQTQQQPSELLHPKDGSLYNLAELRAYSLKNSLQELGVAKDRPEEMTEDQKREWAGRFDQIRDVMRGMRWKQEFVPDITFRKIAESVASSLGLASRGVATEFPHGEIPEVAVGTQQFARSFDIITSTVNMRFKLCVGYDGKVYLQATKMNQAGIQG